MGQETQNRTHQWNLSSVTETRFPLVTESKIPCIFPVKFSFFPLYFRNIMTRFVTSKIEHQCHATIVSTYTFLILTFYLKIFKFPMFSLCFAQIPWVFPVWKNFSPFSLFSLWSGNPATQPHISLFLSKSWPNHRSRKVCTFQFHHVPYYLLYNCHCIES